MEAVANTTSDMEVADQDLGKAKAKVREIIESIWLPREGVTAGGLHWS